MKRWFLVITVVALTAGCGWMRESGLKISETELKNVEAARQVSINYLSIWQYQSGFIKGTLGPRMDEMPNHVLEAIDELDKIAASYTADPNSVSDVDLGQSLGLRFRLVCTTVKEIISFYFPELIELMPVF